MSRPHEIVRPIAVLRSLIAAVLIILACSDGTGPSDDIAAAIRLTLATAGADPDPDGYSVRLDDEPPRVTRANDEVTFRNVAPGAHRIALGGLATNCTPEDGASRSLTTEVGRQATAAFAIACVARVGTVTMVVRTNGIDPDPDGYRLAFDGDDGRDIGVNDSLTMSDVHEGSRILALTGFTSNCTAAPAATRAVAVAFRDSSRAEFDVACIERVGALQVRMATTGADIGTDDYALVVDGGVPQPLGVNGSATVDALREGAHTIEITGVASNCLVAGGLSRTVTVAFAEIARADFAVTCATRLGSMRIVASTSGVDVPSGSYVVTIGDGGARAIRVNGSVTIDAVRERTHAVTLAGIPSNCRVDGDNPREVAVTHAATSEVTFRIACVVREGVMRVTVATTGFDVDADGYTVEIGHEDYYYGFDTVATRRVGTNGSVAVDLRPDSYDVRLVGLARNCRPTSASTVRATVTFGDTSGVAFTVGCVATGGVQVTVATSGPDPDTDGYVLNVSNANAGFRQTANVGTSGSTAIAGLVPGTYRVRLDSVASNCGVSGGATRDVTVSGGSQAVVALEVQCVATGTLRLSAAVSGPDPDADGFKGSLTGAGSSRTFTVGADGSSTPLTLVAPGLHSLRLHGVAENCVSAQPTTQQVEIRSGETTTIAFDLSCTVPTRLAFVVGTDGAAEIHVANSNGTGTVRLTTNAAREGNPTWSRDGQRIAFASSLAGTQAVSDIYHMNTVGTDVVRRSALENASFPTWSPDGRRLAFLYPPDIYVTSAVEDGSGITRLTFDAGLNYAPAWSPDGTRIAFTSARDGLQLGIYVMNADGSGVTRVSRNVGSRIRYSLPAWSPDGRMLAFVGAQCEYSYCESWVGVMNLDGSGATRLTDFSCCLFDQTPAWSPDGRTIAFAAYDAPDGDRVNYVRVDGSHEDLIRIGGHSPSWRW